MRLLTKQIKRSAAGFVLVLLVIGCSSSPESFEELKAAGMKSFLGGRYSEARGYLLTALKEKPSEKELLYFVGLAYRHDYVMDSAFFYVKRANLLYPEDRELTEQLYEIAYAMGEWTAARDALLALLRLGDPMEKHIKSLVDTHTKSGSTGNTYYFLKKWYYEFGLNEKSRFRQLASLAATHDSFDTAHAVLDSAINRWGLDDDCLVTLSEIYFKERRMEEAIAILRELTEKYPENLEYKMNMAHGLSNMKTVASLSEAKQLYREIQSTLTDPTSMDSIISVVEEMQQNLSDTE